MKKTLVIGAGCALLGLFLIWAWAGGQSSDLEELTPASGGESAALQKELAAVPKASSSASVSPVGAAEEISPEREVVPVGRREVTGQVLDAGDLPVAGAEVSLTAWTEEVHAYDRAWLLAADDVLEGATTRTQTDDRGFFRIGNPRLDSGSDAFVLWVSHVGELPFGKSYPGARLESGDLKGLEIHLEPAPTLEVQVTEAGVPAGGAEVVQRARRVPGSLFAREEGLPNPEWVFLRKAVTGPGGDVVGVASRFDQELHARRAGREAAPFVGKGSGVAQLELQPVFWLEGVLATGGGPMSGWGNAHIKVLNGPEGFEVTLADLMVRADGTFGPDPVPLGAPGIYAAVVAGGDAVMVSQEFPAPGPGQHVSVSLETQPGGMAWLQAQDMDGAPIVGCEGEVFWRSNGRLVHRSFPSDAEGAVLVAGLPSGTVWGRLSAPGFAPALTESFTYPEVTPEMHTVTLLPAQTLRGRCLVGDQPVTDFELHYWSRDWPFVQGVEPVMGSQDGLFEVTTAPQGGVAVMAFSPEVGVSQTAFIEAKDGDYEVELHMQSARQATGRLVDPKGQPVVDAQLQVLAFDGLRGRGPVGPPVVPAPDGSFVVDHLGTDGGRIQVTAKGYSSRVLQVRDLDRPSVELGAVVLVPPQGLRVRAALPPSEETAWVAINDAEDWPLLELSSGQDVFYPVMDAGQHLFVLVGDQTHVSHSIRRELVPGEDWVVEFDMAHGETVEVHCDPRGGDVLARDIQIAADHRDALGQKGWTWGDLGEDGRFEFSGVGPGSLVVSANSIKTGLKVHKMIQIEEGGGPYVVELVMPEEALELSVLDGNGQPLPGAFVAVLVSGGNASVLETYTEDNGSCTASPLGLDSMFVVLEARDGRLGIQPYHEPADPEDVIELVLDAHAAADVTFVEAGLPSGGISCTIRFEEIGKTMRPAQTSGADGHVRFEELAAGGYWIDLDGEGIVPDSVLVYVGGPPTTIEVWSRTMLSLKLIREDGTAAAGETVELFHTALGEMVAEGLADGTLTTSTGSMQTDASGRLVIKGLARGAYTWTVGVAGGELQVAQAGSHVTLMVP